MHGICLSDDLLPIHAYTPYSEMEQRKRKISVEGPPGGDEDEVIGPLPVGEGGGTKKRKGKPCIWREI